MLSFRSSNFQPVMGSMIEINYSP